MGGGNVAAETMTRKKKKKGRPSLLELQKRSLKLQQQQEHESPNLANPNSLNSNRRSTRRNPNSDGSSPGGDEDDERQQKKHKLLHGLDSRGIQQHYPINSSGTNSANSNLDGEDPDSAALKRRKIGSIPPGSAQTGQKALKATDTLHGSALESGPTTPLPDKKLLVFILDRLQKKDTYSVFSEPVDPEELPDYHEIISNPMDFGTVRKKLEGGAYRTLEQFENDVFLICSNAMQYNSSDTVYYRQARSILEVAKKDFENLRQESDDSEPQPQPQPKVVRRGRPPGSKTVRKSLESSSMDRIGSEFSSDAALATGGDASNWQNNARRGTSAYKLRPADTLVRPNYGSYNHETHGNFSSEWENEFPASVVRAVMKYGMKHFAVDENKRDTYNNSLASVDEKSLSGTLDGGPKQLIPVGLYEHGYATSLARFAANLGPAVWKIASKKIERVLPPGIQFGPGWVGDNEQQQQQQPFILSDKEKSLSNSQSDGPFSPSTPASNGIITTRFSSEGPETVRGLNSQTELMKNVSPYHFQQRPGINGFHSGFGMVTPIRNPDMNPSASSSFGIASEGTTASGKAVMLDSASKAEQPSWHSFPPDLNVRFLSPGGSPSSSSLRIGSPQQPDLALQL